MTLDEFKILLGVEQRLIRDKGVAWYYTYSNNLKRGYKRKFYCVGWVNPRKGRRGYKYLEYRLRKLFKPEINSGKVEITLNRKPWTLEGNVFSVTVYWNKESNHANR